MRLLIDINDTLAFLLELAMLAILGWWGYRRGNGRIKSAAAAAGIVLAAVLVWSTFAAPQAWVSLPQAGVVVVEALVFTGAATALATLGHRGWAVAFAAVVTANLTLGLITGI